MPFRDRTEAGQRLAARLRQRALADPVVLALPRGGVPVAYEIARELGAPLEVFVARKLGAPGHEELGIGAIAEGSDEVVVSETARMLGLTRDGLDEIVRRERAELQRRIERYRYGIARPSLHDRDVILVDDGLATGVTAEAALRALRARRPRQLVLAVPVCARDTARRLAHFADVVECVESSADFVAVGAWYDDFSQTTDDEVVDLLERAGAA
jgi:putative phosphoribosyl transferase